MDLKQNLIDLAREATGDSDIAVAGDFTAEGPDVEERGWCGCRFSDRRRCGRRRGAGDRAGAGAATGSRPALPRLCLMTLDNAKGIILAKHLVVTDTLDRERLDVEMQQKMTVRTAVVTDTSTGNEYEIEGKRILFHHMSDMLDAPQDPRAR